MKAVLNLSNKYFFITVTALQTLCAIIWLVIKAKNGDLSVWGLVTVLSVVLLVTLPVFKDKKTVLLLSIFIFTLPTVLGTAASGHLFGLPDKPAGSFEQLLVQRFVWPYNSEISYSYYLDVLPSDEITGLSKDAELLFTDLFPAVENKYHTYSPEVYKEYARRALESQKSKMLPDMLKEFAEYFFTPVTACANALGITGSADADAYSYFAEGTGKFGRFYMIFSGTAFVILAAFGIFTGILNKTVPGVKTTLICLMAVILITLYDFFFPVRGFDFRNGCLITLVWAVYIAFYSLKERHDNT